jgi:hypothetical protein
MKGQFGMEQLISLSVFIVFVVYFFFQFLNLRPTYLNEVKNERIRSEAYQISELLVNDPGYPLNWNANPTLTQRAGLSDETQNKTNLLSLNKINAFNSECVGNGYYNVKKWIGAENDFSIFLTDKSTGTLKIGCYNKAIVSKGINVTVRRIVTFGSSYGELILQMW